LCLCDWFQTLLLQHVDITVQRDLPTPTPKPKTTTARKVSQFTRLLSAGEGEAVSGESIVADAYDDYTELMEEAPKKQTSKKKVTPKPKKFNRRTRDSTRQRGGNRIGYRYGIA
jgi:hypothetical protein